ncbi:hypothetical protein, partial [Dickeya dadantii]|uniref:hypothetical protein n=1 Tax=Dickeya dadantii TaxID=204038 RepID=UPI001F2D7A69
LTRRSRSPQHSFNAGKTLHFALIGFVSSLTPPTAVYNFFPKNSNVPAAVMCLFRPALTPFHTIKTRKIISIK